MGRYYNDILTHSDTMLADDELMHYGVLGMKWGMRRNRSAALDKAMRIYRRKKDRAEKLQMKSAKALRKGKIRKAGKYAKKAAKKDASANKMARKANDVFYNEKTSFIRRKSGANGEQFVSNYQDEKRKRNTKSKH